MSTFIVTFELIQPALNQERLLQRIRAYPSWARVSLVSYLILTPETVVQVRDQLVGFLKPGDKLFVGNCPVPSAWHGQPEDVSKWILENQPKA
jgi:hypothetical protein